jgi:hypothetical protein
MIIQKDQIAEMRALNQMKADHPLVLGWNASVDLQQGELFWKKIGVNLYDTKFQERTFFESWVDHKAKAIRTETMNVSLSHISDNWSELFSYCDKAVHEKVYQHADRDFSQWFASNGCAMLIMQKRIEEAVYWLEKTGLENMRESVMIAFRAAKVAPELNGGESEVLKGLVKRIFQHVHQVELRMASKSAVPFDWLKESGRGCIFDLSPHELSWIHEIGLLSPNDKEALIEQAMSDIEWARAQQLGQALSYDLEKLPEETIDNIYRRMIKTVWSEFNRHQNPWAQEVSGEKNREEQWREQLTWMNAKREFQKEKYTRLASDLLSTAVRELNGESPDPIVAFLVEKVAPFYDANTIEQEEIRAKFSQAILTKGFAQQVIKKARPVL